MSITNKQTPEQKNAYKTKRRLSIRAHISNLKESQPCTDCGFFFIAPVMEYDHLPQYKKTDTVSRMVAAQIKLETILAEVAKCDLVCSNCHAIRTHNRRKNRT